MASSTFGLKLDQSIRKADIRNCLPIGSVSTATALRLFHQSVEQNYAPAQCRLGSLYCDGKHGIEKDPAVAVQWFRLAAAQNDSVAQNWLAYCLANGEGTEQNIDEAFRIWKTLARKSPDLPF